MPTNQTFYAHNSSEWQKRLDAMSILSEPAVRRETNAYILPLRKRSDVTTTQGSFEGGVCDKNFRFITGHQRDKKSQSLNYACLRGYRVQNCAYRDETVVYGGVLFGHFGHFILDALSRMWFMAKHPEIPHKYIFLKIPDNEIKFTKFLELAGLRPDQYEVLTEPTQFAQVIIPGQAFFTNDAGHPQWLSFFDRIRNNLYLPHVQTSDRLYLTRTQFERNDGVNEEFYEQFFADHGYTVIMMRINFMSQCLVMLMM